MLLKISKSELIIILFIIIFQPIGQALGLSYNAPITFQDPNPIKNEEFGWVSIDGNNILIGAPRDTISGQNDVGQAYLFDRSGNLLKTIQNPNPVATSQFGIGAISGNNMVISAANKSPGIAYVFDATSGNLIHTLQDPNVANGNSFGYSVSISGNNIVIGDPFLQNGPPNGAVYLFDAVTGNLKRTFTNLNPTTADFGISVFVTGNNILIGSDNGGVVYLFDANTGNLLKTFNDPNPGSDNFGSSLAMDGNDVLIGAQRGTVSGKSNAGMVYMFDATSGNLLLTIQDPTPTTDDLFGESVAISGNTIAVGSIREGTQNAAGSVYVFDTNGNLLQTLQVSNIGSHDRFGWKVDLSGNDLLVGSTYYPTNDPSNPLAASGKVFLYTPVSISVPEFPVGIPVVIVVMTAFYFVIRQKFNLKILKQK